MTTTACGLQLCLDFSELITYYFPIKSAQPGRSEHDITPAFLIPDFVMKDSGLICFA